MAAEEDPDEDNTIPRFYEVDDLRKTVENLLPAETRYGYYLWALMPHLHKGRCDLELACECLLGAMVTESKETLQTACTAIVKRMRSDFKHAVDLKDVEDYISACADAGIEADTVSHPHVQDFVKYLYPSLCSTIDFMRRFPQFELYDYAYITNFTQVNEPKKRIALSTVLQKFIKSLSVFVFRLDLPLCEARRGSASLWIYSPRSTRWGQISAFRFDTAVFEKTGSLLPKTYGVCVEMFRTVSERLATVFSTFPKKKHLWENIVPRFLDNHAHLWKVNKFDWKLLCKSKKKTWALYYFFGTILLGVNFSTFIIPATTLAQKFNRIYALSAYENEKLSNVCALGDLDQAAARLLDLVNEYTEEDSSNVMEFLANHETLRIQCRVGTAVF